MLGTGSVFQDSDELISELKKKKKEKNKWESQNIFFIIRPPSCLSFKGFQG